MTPTTVSLASVADEVVVGILRAVQHPDELTWRDAAQLQLRGLGHSCVIEPCLPFADDRGQTVYPRADLLVDGALLVELKIPHGEFRDITATVQFRDWQKKILGMTAVAGIRIGVLMVHKGPVWRCDSFTGVQGTFADLTNDFWKNSGVRAKITIRERWPIQHSLRFSK